MPPQTPAPTWARRPGTEGASGTESRAVTRLDTAMLRTRAALTDAGDRARGSGGSRGGAGRRDDAGAADLRIAAVTCCGDVLSGRRHRRPRGRARPGTER